jgi:hypothetical protein
MEVADHRWERILAGRRADWHSAKHAWLLHSRLDEKVSGFSPKLFN